MRCSLRLCAAPAPLPSKNNQPLKRCCCILARLTTEFVGFVRALIASASLLAGACRIRRSDKESGAEPVFRIRVRLVDARARLAAGRARSTDRQRARSSRTEWARMGGDRRRATIRLDVIALSSVVAGRNIREVRHQTRFATDTVAGRAIALVADGRKRPPTSAVRLWRVPCGQ